MTSNEKQLNSIVESISSMTQADYSKKAIVTQEDGKINTIASKINLLSSQVSQMITELKEKTDLLNISQEISHVGSWMLDLRTNVLTWSDENYRIFGLEPQEFEATYEAFLEIIHPDDREMVDEAYSGSLENNDDGYEIEHRIIHRRTGDIRFVLEKCIHNRDESGEIIVSVGYTQDITESKEAQKLIEQSQQRLITAQRIAKIGSWELNLLTNDLTWSAEMYDLFGFDPKIDAPSVESLSELMTKDDQDSMTDWIIKVRSGIVPPAIEFRIRTKCGQEKWLQGQGELVHNGEGIPIKAFGTTQDITESKKALERERNLNDLKSRFVTIASHQFRTPMTVIRSNSQLLDLVVNEEKHSREQLKEKLTKITSRIQDEIVNMTVLMDDILILEKINSQENLLATDKTPTDIVEFCTRLGVAFEDIQPDGRSVTIKHTGTPGKIEFDQKHIGHVISNLLSNAFKYSSKHNPQIHIYFDNDLVSIEITDYGIGIPKDEIPNLFQPFHRAKNVENISGSGLGLSIAKEYVELNGGEIYVHSVLGESTTFTITIPK